MPFTFDFLDDGRGLEWETTADGAVTTEKEDYSPRFYVAARDPASDLDLTTLQSVYDQHPDVVATKMVTRRPGFRRDEEAVLAVDVAHIDRVIPLARQARQLSDYPVGDLACFNVDLSRDTADGEATLGGRWLVRRPRYRRLHLDDARSRRRRL